MNQTSSRGGARGRLTLPILPRRHHALLGGTVDYDDCLCAVQHLLDPRKLVQGESLARYETEFARTIGVKYGISFSSGRVGLYGLLRALGVETEDEVLLQAPTHIVVANAIRYTGATPIYVDCLPQNYNMDMADAERKVTPRCKVLLLQHTFGIPAQLTEAQEFARRHGLVLIEDCVHALGSRFNGRPVGSFGRAAFFSTEETKTISTTMGGMVVTDDPQLAEKMREFQAECAPPPPALAARYLVKLLMYFVLGHPWIHYYSRATYELLGKRLPLPRPTVRDELLGLKPWRYEQRLSNAQAAVGLCQLADLGRIVAHRRSISEYYHGALGALGYAVPVLPAGAEPAYVRFPVWVADRAQLVRLSTSRLVLGTWFTSVLEEAMTPECGGYIKGSCPNAEEAARHLVNLPTHPRITAADARDLVALFRSEAMAQAIPVVPVSQLKGGNEERVPRRVSEPRAHSPFL
ncbi:aminotransferase class I/II-fold pyridoxal phosphate-dependent enzyme [Geomonas sp. RF6]|uniref:aminotransferase class I/II-fold pyridoxal phosphate-dependent enzyme n=1 Tax=Geomonas sp. RF6 TaxID=2897342 RepID=UPI001E4CCA73|nr:aminotransferase class I/II-fold pyridoxal phosphate-dependent enzyme [Geomonas sp. RF6]UFS69022.1 aminotransferase class I/II-fold pyridoxal phosphate-dependent enzyme [Geomonas sp. RF6]